MSIEAARALIETAMSDVRIVVCRRCRGLGKIREALYVPCPYCKGRGELVESGLPSLGDVLDPRD